MLLRPRTFLRNSLTVLSSLILLLNSCKKTENYSTDIDQTKALKIKANITAWLDKQKAQLPSAAKFIDTVKTAMQLNYIKISERGKANELSVFVPLNYNNKNTGLVFVTDQNTDTIKLGYVGVLKYADGNAQDNTPMSSTIANLYSDKEQIFSGSLTSYSFANIYQYEIGYKSGKFSYIKEHTSGFAPRASTNIKVNSVKGNDVVKVNSRCTYYYAVTHWSDGSEDWDLIGVTCEGGGGEPCHQTGIIDRTYGQIIKTNCDEGGGSQPDITSVIPLMVFYTGPSKITNIAEYVKCFSANAVSSKISILVDQPIPGSDNLSSGSGGNSSSGGNAGHAFIVFSQTMADGSVITRNLGFYPGTYANPAHKTSPGELDNNENHIFNIGIEAPVSNTNFINALDYMAAAASDNYNLDSRNCTSVALNTMQMAGVTMYPTQSGQSFMGLVDFYGYSPGVLGQHIMGMNLTNTNLTRVWAPTDTNSSNSHPNQGSCN